MFGSCAKYCLVFCFRSWYTLTGTFGNLLPINWSPGFMFSHIKARSLSEVLELFNIYYISNEFCSQQLIKVKGKGFPYLLPSIGAIADPSVQAARPRDYKSSTQR